MIKVKCANCGHIWEINKEDWYKPHCPKCNCDFYDEVGK